MTTETALTMTTPGITDNGVSVPTDICPLAIELGIGFADPTLSAFKPSLIGAVAQLRQTLSNDLGFTVPSISIDTTAEGAPLQYRVLVRGVAVASATVYPSQVMAINTGSVTAPIGGTPTVDPVFGNPAVWIDPTWAPQATAFGYALVDPALVIATHLGEIVRQYAAELLDWDTVQGMIDRLSPAYRSLVPSVFSLGEIHQLLGQLIDEGVSIRDLPAIIEGAWRAHQAGKDAAGILEQVRSRLALAISAKVRADDGGIHAMTLAPSLEASLSAAIEDGSIVFGDCGEQETLIQSIRTQAQALQVKGYLPVLVCRPELRAALRRTLARDISELNILSTQEIARGFTVTVEETVDLTAA